jgi:NFU1 iron-sulfur cluster scaffold homolog, mitochondrial
MEATIMRNASIRSLGLLPRIGSRSLASECRASASARRSIHQSSRLPAITPLQARRRPTSTSQLKCRARVFSPPKRSIYIQTQTTPNASALKFLPNHPVLPEGFPSTFLEYNSPRATLAPPHPSPLAAKLLGVEGVSSVFYGPDFITVTVSEDVNWAHVKPEIFALITEAITTGEQLVNTVEKAHASAEDGQGGLGEDSLAANDEDDEVVAMIKELLETRIRPAIQEDGGDIEYRGFDEATGTVSLKLRGACRTCDSSTVTLKNGIESMLMHYIEEVKGVNQVLDEEEEIAMKEFAKFEEKLRLQRSAESVASI